MVALPPPTGTLPPRGLASAGKAASTVTLARPASVTRVVRAAVDEMRDRRMPWRTARANLTRATMGGLPLITFGGQDEVEPPVVPWPLHGLVYGQVRSHHVQPADAESTPSRCGLHVARCPDIWGQIMEPAPVREAIELGLGDLLGHCGHAWDVIAQLAQGLDAFVRHQDRGLERAAEHAAPIAAHLRIEQRGAGILPIGGEQEREIRRQRLQSRERRLGLGEIDAAIEAAGQRLAVLGAADALQALAQDQVDLIDAIDRIGPVGIDLEAAAAQAIQRAWRLGRIIEDDAFVLRHEPERGHRKIALARADDRKGQSGLEHRAFGSVT